jgi:hypothetical protein
VPDNVSESGSSIIIAQALKKRRSWPSSSSTCEHCHQVRGARSPSCFINFLDIHHQHHPLTCERSQQWSAKQKIFFKFKTSKSLLKNTKKIQSKTKHTANRELNWFKRSLRQLLKTKQTQKKNIQMIFSGFISFLYISFCAFKNKNVKWGMCWLVLKWFGAVKMIFDSG